MFDHIQVKVKDLKSSKRFYTAALAPLGFTVQYEGDGVWASAPRALRPCGWLRASRAEQCISHWRQRTALP